MSDQVLSISMRPKKLDDIIGQDNVVQLVKSQFNSGRIPHFFLITGNPGCCKTTLSRIIARMLQHKNIDEIDYDVPLSKYDIKEINGSDKNGVDDARDIIENIQYKPFSRAKVYIIDEAHQLTTQAQNAMLKITEEPPSYAYFIFCTNNDSKILPTLKRRVYSIDMKGINHKATLALLQLAKEKTGYAGDITKLSEELINNEITSPGLILQAAEKYFAGVSIDQCVNGADEDSVNSMKLCQLITKGDFANAAPILKVLTKENIVGTRIHILNYLKAVLLSSGSVKIAKAIKSIAEECYDLPTFLANICIACALIKKE